ncbi:MAG TPA: GGDEF domain-containing response regulator [Acidobacteriaceae bacterium]|jgi:two-component system, cell cycle response regulator|nr:GGDEF domain-containing response regulator [Acidobacteriaceae bacterium]
MIGERVRAEARTSGGTETSILLGCADVRIACAVKELLASWRYRAEAVGCGTEALERLEGDNPPGIALLDMDLTAPGGVEIAWELGRRPEPRRTWLVMMSADPSLERKRAALESGCDDFVALPPDALELKLRLRVADRVRGLLEQARKHEADVQFHATHDGLTGLWNREALLSLIFQETDRVQRMKTDLSLMLIDLDGFSRVNHEYGYEAGDGVLTGLANRFRRQLRSYDLIGRCGEDEFLLALPGCLGECALALAERIRTAVLTRPFAVGNDATTLTASFGIAVSRGRSPLVVLREAERALAEAKQAGRNCARCAECAAAHSPEELRICAPL